MPNSSNNLNLNLMFEILTESLKYKPEPTRILQSGNRVIVFWDDGRKTIVKRSEDTMNDIYSAFTAALAIKIYGSNSKVHRLIDRKHEYVVKSDGKMMVLDNYERRQAARKWDKERIKKTQRNGDREKCQSTLLITGTLHKLPH